MGVIGIVSQTETGEDGEIVQTVEAHYSDSRYCDQYSASGDDSPPLPDDRAALMPAEGSGNYASVGILSQSQGAAPGEKLIYSRDSDGNLKAKIHLKNDGSIEIEGEGDASVKVSGSVNLTVEGDATVSVSGDASVEAANVTVSGNVKVTGGKFEAGGTVSPTGQGSLCGIPYCAWSGAPQCGSVSQGT